MTNDPPTFAEQDGIRTLHLGSDWIQGAMRVKRPSELVLAYTQQMMSWLVFLKPTHRDRLAILGLGAGALLRFALRHTRAQITTVEWDHRVLALCCAYFRLRDNVRSTIDLTDADGWVADPARTGRFRAVMVDLYDGRLQGPACGDPVFYRACHRILDEPGIMTVNLLSGHGSFEHHVADIRRAFHGRVVCLPEADQGNTIVVAFKGAFVLPGRAALRARALALETRTGLPVRHWVGAFESARELIQAP